MLELNLNIIRGHILDKLKLLFITLDFDQFNSFVFQK